MHIDRVPEVNVEVGKDIAMNPNMGLTTRWENQITRLPPRGDLCTRYSEIRRSGPIFQASGIPFW